MTPENSGASFPTTRWTEVMSSSTDPAIRNEVLGRYWAPIYAYTRRSGRSRDDASDLTQDFLTTVVLGRDLLGRATPDRGRFRAFVRTALRRFLIDDTRSRHRSCNTVSSFTPTDPAQLVLAEPAPRDTPDEAFDRQWATVIMDAALSRLKEACTRGGLDRHWRAFELRVLEPALRGVPAPDLSTIAAEVGCEAAEDVSSMVHTVKRKYRVMLRQVLRESVDRPEDTDAELAELRRFLLK